MPLSIRYDFKSYYVVQDIVICDKKCHDKPLISFTWQSIKMLIFLDFWGHQNKLRYLATILTFVSQNLT